jgi:hypothetical protein
MSPQDPEMPRPEGTIGISINRLDDISRIRRVFDASESSDDTDIPIERIREKVLSGRISSERPRTKQSYRNVRSATQLPDVLCEKLESGAIRPGQG